MNEPVDQSEFADVERDQGTAPPEPGTLESDGGQRLVYMIGNAHIDPVWLWQWQEGLHEVRATFRSALDRMDEYEDFIFTCDSVAYLEWVEAVDPELFERHRPSRTPRAALSSWAAGGSSRTATCPTASPSSARRFTPSAFSPTASAGCGHGRLQRRPLRPCRHAAPTARQGGDRALTCSCGPRRGRKPCPRRTVLVGLARRLARARLPHPLQLRVRSRAATLEPFVEQALERAAGRRQQADDLLWRRQPRRRPDPGKPRQHRRLDAADNGLRLVPSSPRPATSTPWRRAPTFPPTWATSSTMLWAAIRRIQA